MLCQTATHTCQVHFGREEVISVGNECACPFLLACVKRQGKQVVESESMYVKLRHVVQVWAPLSDLI